MKYYKPGEIAVLLNTKPETVYQLLLNKKINYTKMGSNYIISENEFNRFKKLYYKV